MKTILKIIFNVVMYIFLWFLQSSILMVIALAIGLWSPDRIGAIPGLIGILSLFISYVTLKQINKIEFLKKFFNS